MTMEAWIHVAELIIVALLIPTAKAMGGVVIGLRDATRDLTNATHTLMERYEDHEKRIRWIEMNGTYTGPERRKGD